MEIAKKVNIEGEDRALELLVSGEEAAFEFLYKKYVDKVYYFALGLVNSADDAENVTQEVFIKVWESRARIDPAYSFSSYLFTITRNLIFNQHRKKVNERAYLSYIERAFEHSEMGTEKDYFLKELQERIDAAIADLPPMRRKVFEASRVEGLSHKEISAKLGIAEKTIATHIRLALKTMRKKLTYN